MRMFGIAVTSGRLEPEPLGAAVWTRDYLRDVALADLGCPWLGVVATHSGFATTSRPLTSALSLALPVLWVSPCGWLELIRPVYRDRF